MRLRKQLTILSLLTLSLPWAGCQYIKEMSSTLQQGQAAALSATAQAVSARLAAEPKLLSRSPKQPSASADNTLYAHSINSEIIIDGYIDDWRSLEIPAQRFPSSTSKDSFRVEIRAARHQQQLFLYIDVQDDQINYHHPGSASFASGDHIILSRGNSSGDSTNYLISTSAPGSLIVHRQSSAGEEMRDYHIEGIWREHQSGYSVEAVLPLDYSDFGFGVAAVNQEKHSQQRLGTYHSHNQAAALTYAIPQLADALEVFEQPNLRLEVIDRHGWSLASAGQLLDTSNETSQDKRPSWLLKQIYRLALSGQTLAPAPSHNSGNIQLPPTAQNTHSWYRYQGGQLGRSSSTIVVEDSRVGAVLVEQTSDNLLALTGNAFNRLLLYSFSASVIAAASLLLFASWISWRIARLRLAANRAVSEDGQILAPSPSWPSINSSDEIGDLSRHYHSLLGRLAGHTDYLKTLASKLSHELRTPLAVVRSSLDNLEHEELTPQAQTYLQRASEGSERLSKLISAMSAASRVETSIQHAECESFDLAELLTHVVDAYRDIYPQQLHLDIDNSEYQMNGSPELIVQLLDKLSDNASDFCPTDGKIIYQLCSTNEFIQLSVSNDGPLLPPNMRQQLFDSLVSVRSRSGHTPHMGLGLHIVRLITQFHSGQVGAKNRPDHSGVIFTVELPKPKSATP